MKIQRPVILSKRSLRREGPLHFRSRKAPPSRKVREKDGHPFYFSFLFLELFRGCRDWMAGFVRGDIGFLQQRQADVIEAV